MCLVDEEDISRLDRLEDGDQRRTGKPRNEFDKRALDLVGCDSGELRFARSTRPFDGDHDGPIGAKQGTRIAKEFTSLEDEAHETVVCGTWSGHVHNRFKREDKMGGKRARQAINVVEKRVHPPVFSVRFWAGIQDWQHRKTQNRKVRRLPIDVRTHSVSIAEERPPRAGCSSTEISAL